MRTNSGSLVFVLAVLTLLGLPLVAVAEDHDGEESQGEESMAEAELYRVIHIDEVYPDQVIAHEANSREWVKAFSQAGMGEDWSWYASAGNEFTYVYVSHFGAFADLDKRDERNQELAEALGEETMERLNAGNVTVRSHRSEIVKYEPELSYIPAEMPTAPPGFLRVGIHWVKPSAEPEYRALLVKVAEAFATTGQEGSFEVHRMVFGEGSYAVVTTAPSAEAFYARPQVPKVLREAYPEGAEEMLGAWLSYVTNYDTEDYRIRPDLSYVPSMMPASYEEDEMEAESEGE